MTTLLLFVAGLAALVVGGVPRMRGSRGQPALLRP
jgi:hypothetical protein